MRAQGEPLREERADPGQVDDAGELEPVPERPGSSRDRVLQAEGAERDGEVHQHFPHATRSGARIGPSLHETR